MLEAARHGPIVVVNIELPHLSQEALNDHVRKLETLDTLGWLWDAIACPVLNALGLLGLLRTAHGETALDRVVSSYASSVKAIIHSRRRQHLPPADGESRNAVVVAMQDTPKQKPLEYANSEVDAVVAVLNSMGLPHDRPQPCKTDVSSALETCRIFHFAGHGSTHPTEPLKRQLLLDDWDREPFTVASLLETNLTLQPPFLAYLSACGTGQILDKGSIDESIHLANACQLAGFRHVVGTLSSGENDIKDECVSRGLHRAMRAVRDRWVDGEDAAPGKSGLSKAERDAQLKHGSEARRPLWVPYVHFGV
ncbi:CHAT domain-containing protein [Thelonectria olida]|uniref:CHAT domain-containing protein n=1 Tax=Thelonectria olida TaxID=1576542 RepID=A0A9P8VTG4_9HYPO|nr:CHAT domain-containing protein [Thelonectria olida]